MAICGACSAVLEGSVVVCDGVCGNSFHASCLRRASRASASGATTCAECSEIKPCHVLRLVRGMFEAFSNDQSLIADKINMISSNWSGLQIFSDDSHAIREKIDRLFDIAGGLATNLDLLFEKTHDLSSKVSNLSCYLDDLQASFAGRDWASLAPGAGTPPALPVLDDIRRNIRQVKSDFSVWLSTAAANSELIGFIASDVKSLVSRGSAVDPLLPLERTVLPTTELLASALASVASGSPSVATAAAVDAAATCGVVTDAASVGVSAVSSPAVLYIDDIVEPAAACVTPGPSCVAAADAGVVAPEGFRSPHLHSHLTLSGLSNSLPRPELTCDPDASGAASSMSSDVVPSPSSISRPILSDPGISPTARSGRGVRSRRRKRGSRNRAPQSFAAAAVAVDPVSSVPPPSSEVASLRPARRHRCIFVSRVDPDTTEEQILHHISSRIGVPRGMISCSMLGSSRNRVGCSFSASFRVFVPDDRFSAVVSSDTWPVGSIVREFLPRQRPSALSKNSLASSLSTTPT